MLLPSGLCRDALLRLHTAFDYGNFQGLIRAHFARRLYEEIAALTRASDFSEYEMRNRRYMF